MGALNRQEHRALRAIEKSMKADDPELAEQLRSFGGDAVRRLYRYAGWAAGPLLLLGVGMGDAVLLVTGLLLAIWAVLGRTARTVS
ncbi:DUF3040 domain-containing protein [Amycolatopsis vastitatis]|uniref:DUF3040 domain-containing protein n=1 Tax=Amycolatopsis vastitatis TaxID=1905142 RepID=A0A229T0J9_9PSEU|nr:DUF3040 domain-containing protein [Amycolatopsis vastitatis]OXM64702.1 hypothetical protein CF165_26065 [Amycolatopsis vastitatis]